MPRAGPRQVQRCNLEIKLTAPELSQLRNGEVQAAVEALAVHPAAPAPEGAGGPSNSLRPLAVRGADHDAADAAPRGSV